MNDLLQVVSRAIATSHDMVLADSIDVTSARFRLLELIGKGRMEAA